MPFHEQIGSGGGRLPSRNIVVTSIALLLICGGIYYLSSCAKTARVIAIETTNDDLRVARQLVIEEAESGADGRIPVFSSKSPPGWALDRARADGVDRLLQEMQQRDWSYEIDPGVVGKKFEALSGTEVIIRTHGLNPDDGISYIGSNRTPLHGP